MSQKEFSFHLSEVSKNGKTGPIPVSTTSHNSCPPTCPLMKNGCFGDNFPLSLHWDKVSSGERGMNLDQFCHRIAALPDGQIWRHDQVGDLPGDKGKLDGPKVRKIARANKRKRGFTYTHYLPSIGNNAEIVRSANQAGFVIKPVG